MIYVMALVLLCEAGRVLYGNRRNAFGFARYPSFGFAKYSSDSDNVARELLGTEWNLYR